MFRLNHQASSCRCQNPSYAGCCSDWHVDQSRLSLYHRVPRRVLRHRRSPVNPQAPRCCRLAAETRANARGTATAGDTALEFAARLGLRPLATPTLQARLCMGMRPDSQDV